MNTAQAKKASAPVDQPEEKLQEPTTPKTPEVEEVFLPDLSSALAMETESRLQEAEEEFDEVLRLYGKYEEHLRWRSDPKRPDQHHLVPKYEALVAETREAVAQAAVRYLAAVEAA